MRDGGVGDAGIAGHGAQRRPTGAVVELVERIVEIPSGSGREVGSWQRSHVASRPTCRGNDPPTESGVSMLRRNLLKDAQVQSRHPHPVDELFGRAYGCQDAPARTPCRASP